MRTLAEIEAAADPLPTEQQQELPLFLAAKLRSKNAPLPEPRQFSESQVRSWIAEDDADKLDTGRAVDRSPRTSS